MAKLKGGLGLPRINRDWLIYGLSLVSDMCICGVWFAVSRRMSDRYQSEGISEVTTAWHLGLIGGAMFLPYALGTLVSGRLSDRVGRRRLMILGAAIYATATLFCAWTEALWPLVFLFVMLGLGGSIFWPPAVAWLGENKSSTQLRWVMGCFCVAWNLGVLLGNSISGRLYQWSPRGTIELFAIVFSVSALAIFWPSREGTGSGWSGKLPPEDERAAAVEARSHSFVRAAWLGNFTANFGLSGATTLFPQLATSLGINSAVHGDLTALVRFVAIVTFVVVQWTVFWRHRT